MKREIKSLCVFIFAVALMLIYKPVNAEEYFYTNDNGVSFTEAEYNFFTNFFYEGYQKYMTQAMFDEYIDAGIDFENAEIDKVGMCVNSAPNSMRREEMTRDFTYLDTYSKSIEMGRTCGILCRVSSVVNWHGTPTVQSHDVMGSYIDGPTRISTPTTIISSSAGGDFEDAIVYDTNGYGAVISLPDEDDIVVSQSFAYTGNGVIFMSYQHALTDISLQDAQLFSIGLSGYGNVFIFDSSISYIYDGMNGLYMMV